MELTPEQQAAMDQQKAQCPFCQIIKGKIPSKKVYEDDLFLGILDINPAAQGHVLFMPKEHYPIMPLIPPEVFKKMIDKMQAVSKAVKEALLCKETTVFIANGGPAGQRSAHFMLHIIPREIGDGLDVLNVPANDPVGDDVKEVTEKVQSILNMMLNKNLAALGYIAGGAAVPKMSKEQLVQVLMSNPQVKELIEKNPDGFKQLVPTHPQLKDLFKDFDVDEIIGEMTGKKVISADFLEEPEKKDVDYDAIVDQLSDKTNEEVENFEEPEEEQVQEEIPEETEPEEDLLEDDEEADIVEDNEEEKKPIEEQVYDDYHEDDEESDKDSDEDSEDDSEEGDDEGDESGDEEPEGKSSLDEIANLFK